MPIVDAFGVWENLGTVSPDYDWQWFPLSPTSPNSTIRLIYLVNQPIDYRRALPYAYFRASYFSGSQYFFDNKWIRLYPKEEPEIIIYPYPADLITNPLPQRQFQIKIGGRIRYQLETNYRYTVQIFEKISTNVIYPTSPVNVGNVGGATGTTGTLPPGGF